MRSGAPITLRQLVAVTVRDLAWLRIYLGGPTGREENFMSPAAIEDAVHAYGDRTVRSVYPGYRFLIIYLD